MKKGRTLSSDEKFLWSKISKTILKPETFSDERDGEHMAKVPNQSLLKTTYEKDRISKKASLKVQDFDNSSKGMDQNILKRLKRGKLFPEAKLDLHGFTADQAHETLIPFVRQSYKLNKRLILVITGKGERNYNSNTGFSSQGILKRKVPQWLKLSPINCFILEVVEAHVKDGGSGALYVYLKKNKKVNYKHG